MSKDLDAKKKVKEEKKKNKVAKKLQEKQAGSLSKSLEHIMKQAQKKQLKNNNPIVYQGLRLFQRKYLPVLL
jgi:hypothetical protein